MARIFALLVLVALAACSATQSAPQPYQEPGFTAYCKAHPGVGTCP